MHTQTHSLRICIAFLCIFFVSLTGCKKEAETDDWQETKDVAIMAYKSEPDPVTKKEYLNIIYENIGNDTYSKIKYRVITRTGTKMDTIENTIIPTTVLGPKLNNRRLVPRHIGEEEAKFDEVRVAKVWVVKEVQK